MKSVICILTLLCTVYALEQNYTFERAVNTQKSATKLILNSLLIFEKRTKEDLETNLNKWKTDALVDIHNIINEALKNIYLSVNKGRQQGKKVDECYDYAKNNLERKNTNAIDGLRTCIQNGYTAMADPLAKVGSCMEAGKKLLTDLDNIIPNCHSTNYIKMQVCVIKNLVLTKLSLNSFSNNAKQVIGTVEVTHTKTILDVLSCIKTNADNFRTFSTDIVVYTDNCIKNAPKDIPKPSTSAKPPIVLKSVV